MQSNYKHICSHTHSVLQFSGHVTNARNADRYIPDKGRCPFIMFHLIH